MLQVNLTFDRIQRGIERQESVDEMRRAAHGQKIQAIKRANKGA